MSRRNVDVVVRAHDRASKTFGFVGGAVRRLFGSLLNLKNLLIGGLGFWILFRLLKRAATEFADFQKEVAMVSTMLDEQGMKHLPAFEKGLERLSIQMGESTKTLSKGLFDILSASVAPAKAMKFLAVASRSAVAGMSDTATAADTLTTVMNSYDVAAEHATATSDILFNIIKKGKIDFTILSDSIGKIAASASGLGIDFREVAGAIATMTRSGIRAPQAMTALRAVLKSFTTPADNVTKAAKQFGLELNIATAQAKGLLGVFRDLKAQGATGQDIAAIFPSARAMAGVFALFNNIPKFADDIKTMANSAGATREQFDKMAKTSSFLWGQAKQSLIAVARTIGAELAPTLNSLSQWFVEKTPAIRKWISEFVGGFRLANKEGRLMEHTFDVIWGGLKIVWDRGVKFLRKTWERLYPRLRLAADEWLEWFVGKAHWLWTEIRKIFAGGFGSLKNMWEESKVAASSWADDIKTAALLSQQWGEKMRGAITDKQFNKVRSSILAASRTAKEAAVNAAADEMSAISSVVQTLRDRYDQEHIDKLASNKAKHKIEQDYWKSVIKLQDAARIKGNAILQRELDDAKRRRDKAFAAAAKAAPPGTFRGTGAGQTGTGGAAEAAAVASARQRVSAIESRFLTGRAPRNEAVQLAKKAQRTREQVAMNTKKTVEEFKSFRSQRAGGPLIVKVIKVN